MPRPFWSGHFQISLVSFGIQLYPATEAKSEIRFHQLNRKTGERIRHQKVSSETDAPVEKDEIVKGYEYSKGQYVRIEPEDIESLRIPSRETLEVVQFVDRSELSPKFFEKPYFVTPQSAAQAEAFAVVRKAMQSSGKIALGKIAFSGREHLVAIAAPEDDEQLGMMAYTMRYAEELRSPQEYFGDIKKVAIDDDQLELAKELIKRKSGKFEADRYTDDYEAALRAMVEAKVKQTPAPQTAPAPRASNVISLMDALRKSVASDSSSSSSAAKKSKPASAGSPAATSDEGKSIALVSPSKKPPVKATKAAAKPASKRKSA